VKPHIVSEIRDQRGAVLYRATAAKEDQVYDPNAAAMMTGMLANVVRSGTGVQAQIPKWQIAGKTGTSQSWRDAWFVGYSARLVGGVWIGNDDDRATRKATGGSAAAALFAKVMTAAHRGLKPEPLPGADLGANWLGSDSNELALNEWFEFPEIDLVTEDLPEFVSASDESSGTPSAPLSPLTQIVPPPLSQTVSPPSLPDLPPPLPSIDTDALPPAVETESEPDVQNPPSQEHQEPDQLENQEPERLEPATPPIESPA
jgi:penicillin-binding protein 1A